MVPPQTGDMTEANNKNPPARSRRKSSQGETPAKRPSPEYTPRQKEKMQKGLRILAKVIVRAHLRKQAEQSRTE